VGASFVWFDLGYTLVYRPREQAYRQVLAEMGFPVTHEALERAFHVVDKHFMRSHPGVFGHDPETYMPWFLGELHYALGIRADIGRGWRRMREVEERHPECWVPFAPVPGALAGLQDLGVRMGVITNWDVSARSILERTDLARYFEQVVVSSEVGCEKPERRIFDLAADRAGVPPLECLYVGDNYYVDAVGARAAGMRPLVVNRFGRLGVEEITDEPIIGDVSEVVRWVR
jgi:putative hydrolase of the HAD superfamily